MTTDNSKKDGQFKTKLPIIKKSKCMIRECTRQTQTILYFLVGPELKYRSLIGALCKEHAEEKKEYLGNFHNKEEVIIEDIDYINKRIEEEGQELSSEESSEEYNNTVV
jgi:hypothetical protein